MLPDEGLLKDWGPDPSCRAGKGEILEGESYFGAMKRVSRRQNFQAGGA
jgi:hypothetical protein